MSSTRSAARVAAAAFGPLVAAAVWIGLVAVPAEAANQCAAMSVDYAVPRGITLSPSHLDVRFDGCVIFTNQTATTATITVLPGYSVQLGFGESTSGARNYVGRDSGTHAVSVRTATASAGGSITVGASPAPSPAPTGTRSSATSHSSSAPSPRPSPASSGPQVAPTPTGAPTPTAGSPTPRPRQARSPAVSPTSPVPLSSSPGPSRSPVVVAGRIEPPTDRSLGLPGAVAALAVVGTGAALLRVLLAEPTVDSDRTVGGRA